MPINFQQAYSQIKQSGAGAKQRQAKKEDARKKALALLNAYSDELDALRAKVESAKEADAKLRCALPLDEALAAFYPAPDSVPSTLIAADGSQIVPNRHEALQYYVVNVGAIALQSGADGAPIVETDTEFKLLDEFDDEPFSEGQIALLRDVAERKKLLQLSERFSGTVIALTEGQLELWGGLDNENAREFEKTLRDYLNALCAMREKNMIVGGYVDKPGANWVVKLLEVASAHADELKALRKTRPLAGATDLWLFGQILGAGERSALFAMQAKSAEQYKDELALHFFYLNVGDKKRPKIARVDVPRWVATNPPMLNALHAALVEQAKIMGAKYPFPYLLHRAHEIAVVTYKEKEEIDRLLDRELRAHGVEVDEKSGKQFAKDL
ncbi:MAG: DNA double-strand break repair nuclease NurA [Anaerolineales bacterium]|nr:DNA double-strand break repair nuclease NurA [Anaerolineales bacterium]